MRRPSSLLLFSAAALCMAAFAADPMDSVQCHEARSELDAALRSADGSAGSARQLAQVRSNASRECLGALRPGPQRKRSGAPEPAQAVPPPRILAAPPAHAPLPAPPALPHAADRPIHVTPCDPAGCWDSRGRRLNQVGPLLTGPRGPCNLQGGVVSCP